MSDQIWKSLLAEFIGTFTLVFVGASAVAWASSSDSGMLLKGLAFGLALITLIYMWNKLSGAHFNPAVSLGFAVSGQMGFGLMIGYWIVQLLGGIAAAALVAYLFGTATNNAGASVGNLTYSDSWKAVLVEAILTFFLVLAYLFFYSNPMMGLISGLAIGLILAFAMFAGGSLTGASMNPARSLGPAIFGSTLDSIWIYIVGPLIGALVAALIYKLITYRYGCCYKKDECGEKIKDECGNCIMECKVPKVDCCGELVKDECGKVCYDVVEEIQRKKGYKQEDIFGDYIHKKALKHLAPKKCGPCGEFLPEEPKHVEQVNVLALVNVNEHVDIEVDEDSLPQADF